MQLVVSLTADPRLVSSIPAWPHTFMEIDWEIIFMVALPIQEELSVTRESMCNKYWLTTWSNLPRNKCV